MAYRALIRKYIDKAFFLLQDIPTIVTFKKRGGRVFNFNVGRASEPYELTKRVKVVILDGERRDKDVNIIYKRLLLRHDLIATVRQYDVVEIEGVEWTVGDFVKSEVDFIVYLEVFIEAASLVALSAITCTCLPHEAVTASEIHSIFDGTLPTVLALLNAHKYDTKPHICACLPHEDISAEEIQSIFNGTLNSLLPSLYYNKPAEAVKEPCNCLPHEEITTEDIESLFEGGD